MCFYLGAEGHIGCLKTLLKDMLVVWRCWKYWAGCLATLSVTWWGKSNMQKKKENSGNVANKNEKKGYLAQKCKEMRAKNLAVKWEKENSYHIEEERFIKKEKKEIWQQNKKRRVTKVSKAWIITTTIIKTKINEDPYHRTRKPHCQTWNLSKILHTQIFRLKVLHRKSA